MLSETLEGCGLSTDPSTDCHHHIAGSVTKLTLTNQWEIQRTKFLSGPIAQYVPNNLSVSKIPIRVHIATLNYQRKSVLAPGLYNSTFLDQETCGKSLKSKPGHYSCFYFVFRCMRHCWVFGVKNHKDMLRIDPNVFMIFYFVLGMINEF